MSMDMPDLSGPPFYKTVFDYSYTLADALIRRRVRLQLSIEVAARLARLSTDAWKMLEDGWVPESPQLKAIAEALHLPQDEVEELARVSQANQGSGFLFE